jgi:hypothetical protein
LVRTITAILLVTLVMGGCASGRFELQSTQRRAYRIEQIKNRHPDWDEITVQKVASRRIEIGMIPEMVRTALGKPDRVSREGGEEIWGYAIWVVSGEAPAYEKFVYFVHFKEGEVVGTTGDRSQLSYVGWGS